MGVFTEFLLKDFSYKLAINGTTTPVDDKFGILFNTPPELLAHMKNTGVNSLSETTWTVKKVKDFCDRFSKKYSSVCLTYAPVIIIAQKKN